MLHKPFGEIHIATHPQLSGNKGVKRIELSAGNLQPSIVTNDHTEGILLFSFEEVADQLDYRVFRRCPEPVRFDRRVERDTKERGRSLPSIESQLAATVKPMHDLHVEPFADRAHLVTEHGQDLDAITALIVDQLGSLTAAAS
jgi:uridine kinase